jgi:methyl-accepting chemotaxis protein
MNRLMVPAAAMMGRLSQWQRQLLNALIYSLSFAAGLRALLDGKEISEVRATLALLGILYLCVLYLHLSFRVQSQIGFQGVVGVLQRLGTGDFSHRSQLAHRGTSGLILEKLQQGAIHFAQLLRQVRASVETINAAAHEVSAGHVNLSRRTDEQASTLEQTSAGMDELASTVRQNATNCEKADEFSKRASEVAQKGAQTVHRAVERMALIDESSKKIVDIVGVIEGIAFQTNILALNAAVEASRAGEQGRAFAVVASEVRSLAQRCAQAAEEIKALIEESVANVSEGGRLVNEAGATINEIVVSVGEGTELIGQIAVGSKDQSRRVEEINKALAQMDGATRQNAGLVEQATAAILSLEEQASRLAGVVDRFKFPDSEEVGAELASGSAPPRSPNKAAMPKPVGARPNAKSALPLAMSPSDLVGRLAN